MAQVVGSKEYERWKKGKRLTMKEVILANCYMCNGQEDSASDCQGKESCPIYAYSPHGRKQGLHLCQDAFSLV